jgi:hypothetical protein
MEGSHRVNKQGGIKAPWRQTAALAAGQQPLPAGLPAAAAASNSAPLPSHPCGGFSHSPLHLCHRGHAQLGALPPGRHHALGAGGGGRLQLGGHFSSFGVSLSYNARDWLLRGRSVPGGCGLVTGLH